MTRVERNKGGYYLRRNGNYQVKYPLGWNDSKKRYDEYHEEVSSEAEAIDLIKTINDYVYHGGKPQDVPDWRRGEHAREKAELLTVAQFSEEYISIREKQKSAEPRTIQSYRECFARIEPYIGDMLLAEVGPHDIDKAYACMRSDGADNLNGRSYSGTTLQKTHAYIKMLFEKAVSYGYIPKNPCQRVTTPKRDTPEKVALGMEEVKSLFSSLTSNGLTAKKVGVLLLLCCGMRESEMLALKWSDYSDGIITVNKSLVREKQIFKSTKTGEVRRVPIVAPLVKVLDDWKEQQKAWYESPRIGLHWSKDCPIVHAKRGKHTLQRAFGKWFTESRKDLGLSDNVTPHTLRHTFVTILFSCGVPPRTIRELSGHESDEAFATYQHTDDSQQRLAIRRYGLIFSPDKDTKKCGNCKFWKESPLDVTKGACWAHENDALQIMSSEDCCDDDDFVLRPFEFAA